MESAAIFRERLTPDAKDEFNVPGTYLYVEPLTPTSSHFAEEAPRRVVSTSLFVFPKRLKTNPVAYVQRLHVYMKGIGRSLEFLQAHGAGWLLRVYVDYSAAWVDIDGDGTQSMLDVISKGLAALKETYGKGLQLVAVRYAMPGYHQGNTFLPSMWRFLPLFDAEVDTMLCIDADNPIGPLLTHFVGQWLASDKTWMFLIPQGYTPPWCGLASAHNNYALCPNAQLWGARRKAGSASSIEPVSMLFDMIGLAHDPDFKAVVRAFEDAIALLPAVLSRLGGVDGFARLAAETKIEELMKPLNNAVEQTIAAAGEANPLAFALRNRQILTVVTSFIFARTLSRLDPTTRWLTRETVQAEIQDVVLNNAFGVDEWVLQLPLDKAVRSGTAMVLRTNSPEYGLDMHDTVKLRQEATTIIDMLTDAIGPTTPPFGELAARTIVFLRLLSPRDKNTPPPVLQRFRAVRANYLQRLYVAAKDTLVAGNLTKEDFERIMNELYKDNTFYKTAMRRLMYIKDRAKWSAWLRKTGAYFNEIDKQFSYRDVDAFEEVKKVLVRGVFLTNDMMHMFKDLVGFEAAGLPF